MNFQRASRVVGALASVFLMAGAASAASVGAGQFNLASSVYLTNTAFLIGFNAPIAPTAADQMATILLPTTGAFSDLSAVTQVSVMNLYTPANVPPGPVVPGGSFVLPDFIVLPDGINVDLTGLPISTAPLCTGSSTSSCQAAPGSPITLNQTEAGVTASFDVMGMAHYAGDMNMTPLSGVFSAQFNAMPDNTIAGLLNDFATNGYITTSFSATLSTSPVPEPASMALLGAGLLGLGILGKKRLVKK